MKDMTALSKYWEHITVAFLVIVVFCFWLFLYPFVPVTREMSVLFLWNTDYLLDRLAVPGGLAQYLGEGIAQFFLNPFNAALVYAVLFVIAQQLMSHLLLRFFPNIKSKVRVPLSLLPSCLFWYLAMQPRVPLTPTVAALLVMGVGCLVMGVGDKRIRLVVLCLLIPVMYWLTGPLAVLLVLCSIRWIPLTGVLFAASLLGSSYMTPYPLSQVATGIDYCWSDTKKMGTYEEMECDMLMRQHRWNDILQKFKSPESPAVRSAWLYAYHQTGQMGINEFLAKIAPPQANFQQEPSVFCIGDLHFVVYFGTLSSAFMVSDLAFNIFWPNIAQRAAFEAMEYIPNYNKSARALKTLTELCIITEQYALARKYLSILDETTFYSGWAKRMRALVDNPKLIDQNPFFKKSRESYQNTEDLFFI